MDTLIIEGYRVHSWYNENSATSYEGGFIPDTLFERHYDYIFKNGVLMSMLEFRIIDIGSDYNISKSINNCLFNGEKVLSEKIPGSVQYPKINVCALYKPTNSKIYYSIVKETYRSIVITEKIKCSYLLHDLSYDPNLKHDEPIQLIIPLERIKVDNCSFEYAEYGLKKR